MSSLNIFKKESLSLWLKDGISSQIPILEQDIKCDVCVVGAGITGILTAYRLNEAGLKVVLIDRHEPINLATGNTTAKFTLQHNLIYSKILKNYGLNTASLYYESQLEGLAFVRSIIDKHNIPCDFKEASSIIYAENKDSLDEILDEKSAYEQIGIPYEMIYDLPLNIKGEGGLKVDNQFELNPVKFLDFLLSYLLKNGVSIYKNIEAKKVKKDGDYIEVLTDGKNIISCKNLVIATSYPFYDGGGRYFTRLEAHRSYLLAFPTKETLDDKYMMISNSKSPYSLRLSDTDGIKYLLVGGLGHKVGQDDSEIDNYHKLLDFTKTNFGLDMPSFKWSAQDYRSVDEIPYIGYLTSKHKDIYVATGFNKWGMSNGSFSSILITDLISGRESKYEELYNPSRGEIKGNIGSFLKSNLNTAKELIKGKVFPDELKLNDIENDQGGIIKFDGQRIAAYRDVSGKLFLSNSACTHMGCELEYNNGERSFDCPCHGSRFNYDGKVIEGPALSDLKRITKVEEEI